MTNRFQRFHHWLPSSRRFAANDNSSTRSYIRLLQSWMYLVAIIGWYWRYVHATEEGKRKAVEAAANWGKGN